MSLTPAWVRTLGQPARERAGTLIAALAVVGAGVLLGQQIMAPDKRTLAVFAAIAVVGLAWRVNLLVGIGVLMLALPYPRSTVFGSTNLAFILILLIIWLLRMSQRMAPLPQRTPVDAPVAGLLIAYVVSFYNIRNSAHLEHALTNTYLFVGCVLLFYLVVNAIRSSEDLKRWHLFQCAAMLPVLLFSVWELNHQGQVFIPGWLDLSLGEGLPSQGIQLHGQRVGGPFFDYELLCEYCALNILLLIFLLAQARTASRKVLMAGLMVLTTFIMFCTVTRGGFVALALGLGYMLWHIRRRLAFVPFAIIVVGTIAAFIGMNYYVSHFTNAADLWSRLAGTQFKGWMPEARAKTWPMAWERMLQHPIIGYGPFYAGQIGTTIYFWPHCLYLYLGNLVGFVGLSFFFWLAGVLWNITRPQSDRLDDPNYTRGFLLVGHVQLVTFLVDEIKIEYLRNQTYQFQVWLLFAPIVAAHLVLRRERAAGLIEST